MEGVGIYKITNLLNEKVYIGKSCDITRRWKDHQRLAFTSGHKEYEKTLYRAMRKYGIENFNFEVIENISLEKYESISGDRERYWIDYYNSYEEGYNETLGGDGGSVPGHCGGESNPKAKLTEQDIIKIRQDYARGTGLKNSYKKYSDLISYSGFESIWRGKTWPNIMPEVFTKENFEKNKKNSNLNRPILENNKSRKVSDAQIRQIRIRRKQGESAKKVFEDFSHIISWHTFSKIWYYITWKEIQI